MGVGCRKASARSVLVLSYLEQIWIYLGACTSTWGTPLVETRGSVFQTFSV